MGAGWEIIQMGWTTLLDEEGNRLGTVGDLPWDLMDDAIEAIDNAYLKKFGRKANAWELEQIFQFCAGERHNPDITVHRPITKKD